MTSGDIDRLIAEASQNDEQARAARPGRHGGMPVQTLVTALAFAGKDTAVQACPVLVLRLKSSDGRALADSIRAGMQAWDDK